MLFLNEDFPPKVEKRRAFLRPYVRAAWASNKRATMIGDVLLIEGIRYTADTLHELPEDLRPEKVVIKTEGNTTLFYRQDVYMSNFHPSVFTVDGRTYNCNEQYYCSQKAKCFGDRKKEIQIMASTNPAEMKFIGGKISGFNDDIWIKRQEQIMYQGLLAKFSQNKNLGEKLKITRNNFLAESSSNDTFWGTGMAMTNINAFDKTSWNGKKRNPANES